MNSLIPKPTEYKELGSTFILPEVIKVNVGVFEETDNFVGAYLENYEVKPVHDNSAHIYLIVNDSMLPEEYVLEIHQDNIFIESAGREGVHNGLKTLLQLNELSSDGKIPCCRIEDQPRFHWRGVHLDVCRHFFPVSFIKKFIDIIAAYKMNIFHWHLTEDQGWRIEIKSKPLLSEIGSKRIEKDSSTHSGYYTQDEIREVIRYAEKRGVEIVPEIEMPGHASAAVASYPELSCTGNQISVINEWGVFDDVYCAGKESTFDFLESVLLEVIELFPSKYIHIGGDECPKTRWKECPHCRKRMAEEGLKDENELQSWFIKRMVNFLHKHGKTAIGWDEIIQGGLAEEAVVMSWQGIEGAIHAIKNGNKAILSPTSHCYFDYYQSNENEPKAFNSLLPLSKVYEFDPLPGGLSKEEANFILGGQANVWTEYMPNEKQVEYMLLPRLTAMAEVLWSYPDPRDFSDYSERLLSHLAIWEKKGYNYRHPLK